VSPAQRAAASACALLMASAASACELVLSEQRSALELLRVPLDAARPAAAVAFTHSVLGTPVLDRYEWRAASGVWRAHLVEERFEGDGYGLPNAAGPGETLQRDGDGWRLTLDRIVHPLVLPPVPHMRVIVDGPSVIVPNELSRKSIALRVEHCASH
jgi:hypothetical protein